MRNDKYSAQALAIAMVVLVISSIIAISVYSRILKDKGLSLEERASAEALEVSDLILNKLTLFPINDVITALEADPFDYAVGSQVKESKDGKNITALFSRLEINYNLDDAGFCKTEDGNEYILTVKEADANTPYEIRAGQVWALPIDGKSFDSECRLSLRVLKGDTNAGFLITRSYAKYSAGKVTEYKEYDYDDAEAYCFADNSACNNTDLFKDQDSWVKYVSGSVLTTVLDPATPVYTGYRLSEIRVKAIGGNIGIAYTMGTDSNNNACIDGYRMIQLRAAAYCNNVYRGKEILVPEKKWSNALFDYVLLNGEGSL